MASPFEGHWHRSFPWENESPPARGSQGGRRVTAPAVCLWSPGAEGRALRGHVGALGCAEAGPELSKGLGGSYAGLTKYRTESKGGGKGSSEMEKFGLGKELAGGGSGGDGQDTEAVEKAAPEKPPTWGFTSLTSFVLLQVMIILNVS